MPACQIVTPHQSVIGFRYLWLKNVTGFNSAYHCAKCLKGKYVTEFGLNLKPNTTTSLNLCEGDIAYACGVASPFKWANNMHIAMRVSKGSTCSVKLYTGDTIQFDGFEQIPFTDQEAIKRFSHLGPSYLTCRNFHFGSDYFRQH